MLKKLVTTAAAALVALTAIATPDTAIAKEAALHEIVTKRVVIRFLADRALKDACGARARACAYTNANVVVLPEDAAYGWTGTVTARIRVQWHSKSSIKTLDCDNRYACVRGDVIHARDLSFRHRGLAWVGEVYAEAIGLDYNPRRSELLAHELKHVLTGERHRHG